MVKKYHKKARKGGRKGGAKKKGTVKQIVKSMLAKEIERKTKYESYTSTPVPGSGLIAQLNMLAQGLDIGQRIGLQIRHKYLRLDYSITNPDFNISRVRCILFWYRQESLNLPNVAAILNSRFIGATPDFNMDSPYTIRTHGQYKILYDRVHETQSGGLTYNPTYGTPQGNAVGGSPMAHGHIRCNLKSHLGQYVDALDTTDMTVGFLGFLFISDSPIFGAQPTIRFQSTLTYTDA